MTDDERAVWMLKEMIRIRVAEETIAEEYRNQEMRTPMHLSIGQEAVAVGVAAALKPTDVSYSGHRCHAEYLARGGSLYKLVAELYGRADGCSKGWGGSVHLNAPDVGHIASSAILGETVAAAVGSAWAFKLRGEDRVAVAFFGDGVIEEGVWHEAANFAAVHELPVIFVCANNGYSTHTPLAVRQPDGIPIWKRARSYGLEAVLCDGNDVQAVYEAAIRAVKMTRRWEGGVNPWPVLIEATTYRVREHVGPNMDTDAGYRTAEEVDAWQQKDPIIRAQRAAVERGLTTLPELQAWRRAYAEEARICIEQAKQAPWPDAAAELGRMS